MPVYNKRGILLLPKVIVLNPKDGNAPQESFFGHMKDELDLSECHGYEEILNAVRDWTEYYNTCLSELN